MKSCGRSIEHSTTIVQWRRWRWWW